MNFDKKLNLLFFVIAFMIRSFSLSLAQEFDNVVNQFEGLPQTTENVAKAIMVLEIQYPEYVFRQTIKESGWTNDKVYYSSSLAKKGNNVFGMRKPNKRQTYALKITYLGYAQYSHWIYSIIDYKLWQQCNRIKPNETFEHYIIRRSYAKNTKGYVKKLMTYKIPKNIDYILNGKMVNDKK